MNNLNNKLVVVTGAASGIGRALAIELAKRKARLLLADIQAEALDTLALKLRAGGAECHTQITDTGNPDAIAALARFAHDHLGGADVVINNAGVALVAPVETLNPADAQWLMNINFWGVVHGCQQFLPQLKTRPEAMLVNISSIFAMVSMPTQSIYNASKAAVRGFSDALREELRDTSVRVLCVHPGGIQTNIAQTSRITDASLIAPTPQALRDQFDQVAMTTPQEAARQIVQAIERNKTRLLIGGDAVLIDALYRLFPTRVSAWFGAMSRKGRNGTQGMSPTLNKALRVGLLLTYLAAALSLVVPLPLDAGPLLQRITLIVLGLHVLETALAWNLLPRYRGSLPASVGLSLLFGLLHWAPLARQRPTLPPEANP